MGKEIDLLVNYPKTKRNAQARLAGKTPEDKEIARCFGQAFFDGNRKQGYGGFSYDPRFWEPVIPTLLNHFKLSSQSSVLDIGCAKGFMLYDLQRLIPGIKISGIDISDYAIEHSMPEVRPFLQVGNALELPFPDNSIDVLISITTLHNLEQSEIILALKEIERVKKQGSFITVDAYRTEIEKENMLAWNLTAKTILHVDEWKSLFSEAGYSGDYFWFCP